MGSPQATAAGFGAAGPSRYDSHMREGAECERQQSVSPLLMVLFTGCSSAPEGPPFAPVADVSQLMTMMIDPAADAVWDSVGVIIDENGTNEWYPVTDEEWAVVINGAMTITESANLLMIGDRARDQNAWMRMAQGMVEAGQAALAVAESRDHQALYDVSELVYNSCDRCHNLYWVGDEDRGRVRDENPRPPSP